jgi:hypothetical protein
LLQQDTNQRHLSATPDPIIENDLSQPSPIVSEDVDSEDMGSEDMGEDMDSQDVLTPPLMGADVKPLAKELSGEVTRIYAA